MSYRFFFFLTLVSSSMLFAQEKSLEDLKKEYVRPTEIPFLDTNKYSKEREILGKKLFFDPRLSGSGVMSCATCHNPSLSWGDALPKGVGHGHKVLGRRSPTILNLAWAPKLFWDGRANNLEEQALGPIASEGEMNMPLPDMTKKIARLYRTELEKNYPGEEVNEFLIAKAIAIYERKIVSNDAPFDLWIKGDESAISESAKLGFAIFNGKAKCSSCHSGWNFTDHSFNDVGVNDKDLGRGALLKLKSMQHAFKTPGLRNINHRGPYMHNGSEKTLTDVINFYDMGGKVKRPSLNKNIMKLGLSADEKLHLIEFLNTLTSIDPPQDLPILPNF